MRKFTLLIILLWVCSIGFSQSTSVRALGGDNDPTYVLPRTVNQNVSPDGVSAPSSLSDQMGTNQPVFRLNTVYQDPALLQQELAASSLLEESGAVYGPSSSGHVRSMADIIPTAGATETFAVVPGDFFYDPSDGTTGGPGGDCTTTSSGNTGDYPNCGCVTTTTLTGTDLEVEFLSFRVFGTFDFLNIYDGPDTASPQIYDSNLNTETDTLAGMIAANGSAVFTSTSGALTFEFSATAVVNTCGWEVEVLSGGGGGGGSACNTVGPGNAFENGKSCTQNLGRIVAHDVTVPADEDAMLLSLNPNMFIGGTGSGVNAAFVDFYVWGDAGGAPDPGNLITSELGVVPVSQTVVGTNFGFDVWELELDVTDVMLPGTAGSATTYWVGLSVEATDASNLFWENSTAGLVGLGEAYDDGTGGGFVLDNTLEGVYTIFLDCTPMGGGGAPCDLVGPGNAFENGKSCTQNLGRIVAHDFTVPADEDSNLFSINPNVFIGGTGSGVNAAFVDVYVWGDAGGAPDPGNLITSELGVVPVSQTVVGTNFGFDVWELEIDITDVPLAGTAGSPTTYWIGLSIEATDASNLFWENSTAGLVGLGEAYDDGTGGGFVIDSTLEGVYTIFAECIPMGGGPTNDECAGATPVACDDVIVGTTADNTDTGGNPAPDEWYSFTGTGSPQVVTVSLCDGGTDYDSLLRVFDACGGNEIATNDDSCGLQSELSFLSDGTSTYYIMVEGFGSNSGNFSMAITCVDPPVNDECTGALSMDCGDTVVGDTNTATVDTSPECATSITAPGVWYTFTDTSGLVTDYTLSLCDGGTDYDSKLTVYSSTDNCTTLVCITDNDDTCGLQSEVQWQGDGNTTYYFLVHGFGSATGNFSLNLACTPVPPPNDLIVNSIDVDEIGVPYVDPAVAMPAATTEGGNPTGCNIDGANGVWYNFTPAGDGFATATVVSPAGATFVNFFSAPDENSSEDDLTLVDFNGNQCAPQTDAIIPTVAGQAYYVFVVNTGGITDIVIEGQNLGTDDNKIEGFTYYPNPTEGVLNLNAIDSIENVAIYNILGQQVLNQDIAATNAQLDIANLSQGTYILKVIVNGETGTYKLIKR